MRTNVCFTCCLSLIQSCLDPLPPYHQWNGRPCLPLANWQDDSSPFTGACLPSWRWPWNIMMPQNNKAITKIIQISKLYKYSSKTFSNIIYKLLYIYLWNSECLGRCGVKIHIFHPSKVQTQYCMQDQHANIEILFFTYGKLLVFSMQHTPQLHCKLEHKLQQLCRNTHSLPQCHKHTSLSHSYHKMVQDPPRNNIKGAHNEQIK